MIKAVLRKLLTYSFVCCLLTSLASGEAFAAGKKSNKNEVDIYELSIDENLAFPELKKQTETIVEFQNEQAKSLVKLASEGFPYEVETMRNGEVIVVSVPSRHLFNPNETRLSDNGKKVLKPILKYLNTIRLYKIILAMHSDNTGNEIYTLDLTTKRVNSVFDWMGETDKSKTDYVVPYALGGSDPLVKNNSVANRDRNRRLEIYLIPDKVMIEQAKRNNIKL